MYSLVGLSSAELATRDVAEIDLRCALGLPGSEDVNIEACLETLDYWADLVRRATQRHWRQFEAAPDEFCRSQAYFRMMAMVTILQRDLGVRYNPERIDSGDFSDSRDLFIHGLLSGHGGTCVSMPILYLAIGRRLGYPLWLVKTKAHLFVRWHDDVTGERFNIEATSRGLVTHSDDYYRIWPLSWNRAEKVMDVFLKNLSPRQEVATIYAARAHCLEENYRFAESAAAYRAAWKLDPEDLDYPRFTVRAKRRCDALKTFVVTA